MNEVDKAEIASRYRERLKQHGPGMHALATGTPERQLTRFGVLAGPTEWQVSRDRMAGHVDALARVGATQSSALIESIPATFDAGREGARKLLASAQRPTAIVCFNDKVAVGALRAATDAGLRVPDDVTIVGFDDSDLSRATTPELTTVRQPLAELGRVAVKQLLRVVDRQPVDARHVELAMTLVVRGSSGAPGSTR